MIVPDINLLIYAYNSDAPHHAAARKWWEGLMNGRRPIGIPAVVTVGFIRIATTSAVLERPFPVAETFDIVESWFSRRQVAWLEPGPRALDIFREAMILSHATGRLATDAYVAALAIENAAELHSNDADFGRFSGLRWVNPLE